MKRIFLLLPCVALMSTFGTLRSHAIELSLEENRAERGSVGFVDIKRLFTASPDATRAREGLEELVRQAEERVNTKKAELLRLRRDLGALKIEREELAQSTPTATALPPSAVVIASTQTAPAPVTLNLPGMTGVPVIEPALVSTQAAPVAPVGPTLAQRLLEFDGRIVAMQGALDLMQGELDRERMSSERTLLDAEGRKTDQVLARLYRAVSEVAKREGVSVVVEKSATLYGHPAVDLTDKVLKQLQGASPVSP